jgi:hypothetical protein
MSHVSAMILATVSNVEGISKSLMDYAFLITPLGRKRFGERSPDPSVHTRKSRRAYSEGDDRVQWQPPNPWECCN